MVIILISSPMILKQQKFVVILWNPPLAVRLWHTSEPLLDRSSWSYQTQASQVASVNGNPNPTDQNFLALLTSITFHKHTDALVYPISLTLTLQTTAPQELRLRSHKSLRETSSLTACHTRCSATGLFALKIRRLTQSPSTKMNSGHEVFEPGYVAR